MKNDSSDSASSSTEDSVRMNSEDLQREFREIYSNFFHTHDIVISGDGILTWGPDISHGVSVLRIKQKLPLKTFCGINRNDSGKVTFRTLYVYDILHHTFRKKSFEEAFKYPLENLTFFLEEYLHEQGFVGGVEFDFLSEAPPGHGFAFSAVLSVLLAYSSYTISGKLSSSDFVDGQFSKDHPLFEEIYLFSLTLSHRISGEKSIGGGSNYAVMLGESMSPIVYFSSKNTLSYQGEHTGDDVKASLGGDIDMTIYKDTLEQFLSLPPLLSSEFPLDYGILFTGLEYRFGETEQSRGQNNNEEGIRNTFVSETITALSLDTATKRVLTKLLGFDENDTIYRDIDSINLKILEAFAILLKNTSKGESEDHFIETFRQIGLSSFSYQKENPFFIDLVHHFHRLEQFHDEKIAVIPFNTGKMGGSLLFIMKKGYSRTTFQKTLDQLRLDGHGVSLYHASWRDGCARDGVRLEQHISREHYSSHTKKGDVLYTDSHGNSYCDNYDSIVEHETHSILLDTIGGRIYVRGKKLTSQDIHSQNTTIDMLKLLLLSLGEEVPNSRLPLSSYSQNKNEILGKIVLPIKKIAKKYFSEELSLSCTGGITEYYLRLQKDENIVIGLIQKL